MCFVRIIITIVSNNYNFIVIISIFVGPFMSHFDFQFLTKRFLKNYGKSQALSAGFKSSKGDVVITMDADLQDDPNEIPELYRLVKEEKFDLVSGWKKVRYDSYFSKNIPSKVFNWAARITSGVKLNDFNCGIKAYKKDLINQIKLTHS